jgi:hypothetical protein
LPASRDERGLAPVQRWLSTSPLRAAARHCSTTARRPQSHQAHWQRYVLALNAERVNLLVLPLQLQQLPARFLVLIMAQAARHEPLVAEAFSVRP